MVLVAISVFLIFTSETAARATREARVTRVKENAELAFYAADSGFNRARARLIKKGLEADMLALNGRTETLTYTDDDGITRTAGMYTLQVTSTGTPDEYYVISTGVYGEGRFAARRVVAGTITKSGTKPNSDNRVTTVYDP